MNQYTIYCTEAQTRRVYELGAPLNSCYHNDDFQNTIKIGSLHYVEIPTAEQMICWLEEQEIYVEIIRSDDGFDIWYYYRVNEKYGGFNYRSRSEATLAAIDAALEYLENNRK